MITYMERYLPEDFSPRDVVITGKYKIAALEPGDHTQIVPQTTYRKLLGDEHNTVLIRVSTEVPPGKLRQSRMLYRAGSEFGLPYLGRFIADIGNIDRLVDTTASFDPDTNQWRRESDTSLYEPLAGYVAWQEGVAAIIVSESDLVRDFLSSYVDART